MGKYFGTDGFRGEAGKDLRAEHAFYIGRFLGSYYKKEEKKVRIVLGKDTRLSGDLLASALCAGITASGGEAHLLGVTTTPSVAYLTRSEGFDCGIMISASHNPFYDNGIKLLNARGEKMEEETIHALEAYLEAQLSGELQESADLPAATGAEIGRVKAYEEGKAKYANYLISLCGTSLAGMRIGLDAANGSAYALAGQIFDALGVETVIINAAPDGININENAGSTHIQGLQQLVKEKNLTAAFAYDGDADRCLAVDETGAVVDGDLILYIYGTYLQKQGQLKNNTVVTTVMSNFGLYKAFDEAGIAYEKTAVGDKYVYENMKQNGHCLGGEQSGHIIFGEYATTGDGILTSLLLLKVMQESGKTLKELAAPVSIYPQVLENVRVKSKPAAQQDPSVQAAVAAVAEALGESGRILVRESGTEPVIRVMVEAETEDLCRQHVTAVTDVIKARGHVAEK